jgi:uncharacterized protein (DUF2147 family)
MSRDNLKTIMSQAAGQPCIAAIALVLPLLPIVATAQTQEPPAVAGVWLDDTGEGAIEIAPCGDRICGRIVWLRAPLDKAGRPLTDGNNPDAAKRRRPICGLPVIGDLKRMAGGAWDGGWIYDPKDGKSYDVEIKPRSVDQLQVTGYLGTKWLSETFVWTRAPADLRRCQQVATQP